MSEAGRIRREVKTFGTSAAALRNFAVRAKNFRPEIILLESAGVLRRSPYEALEDVGFSNAELALVNARDVKAAVGRKTDEQDAARLAVFARLGKKGNRWLRQTLVECANGISLSRRGSLCERLLASKLTRGRRRAIVAVARKSARIIFSCLKHGCFCVEKASAALRDVCVRKAQAAKKCLRQFVSAATLSGTIVPKGTGIETSVS